MNPNRPPKTPPWERPVWRVAALVVCMLAAGIALVVRLVQVQLLDGEQFPGHGVKVLLIG